MRSLELPAQMSPCLQIFTGSLLDESTASVTHEIQGLPSAPVIAAEDGPVRGGGDGYAHKLIGIDMTERCDPLRWKSRQSGPALMEASGGDTFKGK